MPPRSHYQTLKEDVRLVEAVRKAVGDEMEIMVDANQAQSSGTGQLGVMWDFHRAFQTARELEDLNCLWLEEPRQRYAFDELAELNRLVSIPIAGGENNRGNVGFGEIDPRRKRQGRLKSTNAVF
jgi:D-galactarolactone cycloisomerase